MAHAIVAGGAEVATGQLTHNSSDSNSDTDDDNNSNNNNN